MHFYLRGAEQYDFDVKIIASLGQILLLLSKLLLPLGISFNNLLADALTGCVFNTAAGWIAKIKLADTA